MPEATIFAAPDAQPTARREPLADHWRLLIMVAVALVFVAAYLLIGVRGNWMYVMERRSTSLFTLALVGVAIGASTVIFQTVTHNQILTPSVMGFDSLYLLVQTAAVFATGGVLAAGSVSGFFAQVGLMMVIAVGLYAVILGRLGRSVHLLVLVGLVVGVFFRSLSSFLQRVMDPTQFMVLQDRFFADFTGADPRLLLVSFGVIAVSLLVIVRMFPVLDVLHLGRDISIGLGVRHNRVVLGTLVLVALLVSVSTALVGPTTFFGLLVAHLGYRLMRHHYHRVTVPAACLAAIIVLIGGQVILERLLDSSSSLSIVVEFAGGIVFLVLLLRRSTL